MVVEHYAVALLHLCVCVCFSAPFLLFYIPQLTCQIASLAFSFLALGSSGVLRVLKNAAEHNRPATGFDSAVTYSVRSSDWGMRESFSRTSEVSPCPSLSGTGFARAEPRLKESR